MQNTSVTQALKYKINEYLQNSVNITEEYNTI
jgi:hypothetical protein